MKVIKKNKYLRLILADNEEEQILLHTINFAFDLIDNQLKGDLSFITKDLIKTLKNISKNKETIFSNVDNLIYIISLKECNILCANGSFVMDGFLKENDSEICRIMKELLSKLEDASR